MARSRIHEGDGDPRHGTVNGYVNLKCRGQSCRDAWADYHAACMADVVLAPDDPRHGTVNAYNNYGCRCRPCTDAATVDRRSRMAGAR